MSLENLVLQYRTAIKKAKDDGNFIGDLSFANFPRRCCGDTSDLLGQYLLENGIRTYCISGVYGRENFDISQNHAWLQTEDGIVIDITGDQFRSNPNLFNFSYKVYIGEISGFHKLFEVWEGDIYLNEGINALGIRSQARLHKLYDIISDYL